MGQIKNIKLHIVTDIKINLNVYHQTSSVCVSVSLSTLDKPVVKSVTLVGSCTAWNMESNPMDRCRAIRPSVAVTTHSTLSSAKPVPENTSPEPCSWTWNRPLSTRCVAVLTVNSSTPNS